MRSTGRELTTRAGRVMPGGILASFAVPAEFAFAVRSATGATVVDCAGDSYVDYVLGSGPMIVGHRHPAVIAALTEQLASGTHFYALNEPAVRLAEVLVDAIPCAELVKFTSTGAEATFQTLRLARAATGRSTILRFLGGYHGHHDYGMVGTSAGIPRGIDDTVLTAEFNDVDGTRDLVARHAADLAAVIVEPFQRVIAPAPGFLAALREITTEHGVLLIFDEVVTGFRLAWGGAQERYGVVPDLAAYGKIIGGGLPLGAVAGPAELLTLSDPRSPGDRSVFFSSTLNGNPLAAAAGLATLDVLRDPASYDRLNRTGERLRAQLRTAARGAAKPILISGHGPMVGVSVADGDPHDPATFRQGDLRARKQLETEMLRRKVFVNLGARMYVSTAHTDADVDAASRAFTGALAALS